MNKTHIIVTTVCLLIILSLTSILLVAQYNTIKDYKIQLNQCAITTKTCEKNMSGIQKGFAVCMNKWEESNNRTRQCLNLINEYDEYIATYCK